MNVKSKIIINILFIVLSFFCLSARAESPLVITGANTVNADQAKNLYDSGAIFIDVRDRKSWDYGHISGAMHLSFIDDSFALLYVSDVMSKDTPVVFYCDSSLPPIAAMASFFAASWGYKNVYFYRDGYFSWLASDFPVEHNIASN